MHNGDRLTGTIENVSDSQVRITLPYGSTITVKRSALKRWRLTNEDKPKPTVKTGMKFLTFAPDDLHAWIWTGSSDLNVKLKHTQTKTNNVNIKGNVEVSSLEWRYSLDGEYIYETANNLTNSHEYQLKPMLDFFFDQHWFLRSGIDVNYKMLASRYMDLDYAIGPGYRFWNDKRHRLELMIQAGLARSYFEEGYWDTTNIKIFDERIINYPLLNVGWDYRQPLRVWQENIEIFSKGGYKRFIAQPSSYLTRERLMKGSIGLRYYFNHHVRLSLSSDLDWEDMHLNINDSDISIDNREWRHYLSLGASF
ncbi:hypothetical protein CUC53_01185 [Aeromonas cavernicola]|uniref:DUF481 domain-containing protein n=2 Tax=Aeromonas cavernicola TaxID=1006623 RepID=A0A2H9U9I7_9GAMM|nr:hypothetical protein CUC53_01185 [Aeromonas cavernicola]